MQIAQSSMKSQKNTPNITWGIRKTTASNVAFPRREKQQKLPF